MFVIKEPVIIDIYYDEYPVDFTGVDIAILKASGKDAWGTRYIDSKVAEYSGACAALGIRTGLYHFLRPRNIAEQAALYLEVWDALGSDLPPIVDVEVNPLLVAVGYSTWASHILTFLDLVEAHTGRIPMIYTSQNYWQYTGYPAWAGEYPLWLAWYPYYPDDLDFPPAKVIPKGWDEWALWQYHDKGRSNGKLVNDYNLASDWFLEELGEPIPPITPPVIPPITPPEEDKMYQVTVTWDDGARIRTGPHTGASGIGTFYKGATFKASEIVVDSADPSNPDKRWAKIAEGPVINNYVATRYPGSEGIERCTVVEIGVEPPSEVTLTHTIDVYSDGSLVIDGNPY